MDVEFSPTGEELVSASYVRIHLFIFIPKILTFLGSHRQDMEP
jgi:hypothetical protein